MSSVPLLPVGLPPGIRLGPLLALLLLAPPGTTPSRALARAPDPPRVVFVETVGDHQVSDPGIIWADDFEDTIDLEDDYHDVDTDGGRFGLTTEDAFGGSARSIRQAYEPGQVDAGWIWYFFADHPSLARGDRQTEIYARWYHKFAEGFEGQPPKMARLGGFARGDWTLSFMVHYWIERTTGMIAASAAANVEPRGTSTVDSGYNRFVRWLPVAVSEFDYGEPLHRGRWICHEMRVRLNTPGESDGVYQYWVDGELVVDVSDANLVGGWVERGINGMQFDGYWNGGAPASQSRYYDNIVIATAPIGPALAARNPVVHKSRFADPDPGDRQTGWRLQIAADRAGNDLVWDSGILEDSLEVVVVGESAGSFSGSCAGAGRLRGATLYWLRASQRDGSDQWSAWSPWHSVIRTARAGTGVGGSSGRRPPLPADGVLKPRCSRSGVGVGRRRGSSR